MSCPEPLSEKVKAAVPIVAGILQNAEVMHKLMDDFKIKTPQQMQYHIAKQALLYVDALIAVDKGEDHAVSGVRKASGGTAGHPRGAGPITPRGDSP